MWGAGAMRPATGGERRTHEEQAQVTVTQKSNVTVTKSNSEGEPRMKTALEFDEWVKEKRQRPVGICNECGREKELRQREPEPLCGACYMKIDRREKKAADLLAAMKDARKRDKKIRAEMCKMLNIVDALEGFVAPDDLKQLERVAKKYLRTIIDGPDGCGHGHDESERDQESEPASGDGPAEFAVSLE
jgi:hypothetical protein